MAAMRLGLKSSAVQSVRRELHRKIEVQQRGDLVRVAVQLGYICFTATGVIRPGFELLVRASRRPTRGDRRAISGTALVR